MQCNDARQRIRRGEDGLTLVSCGAVQLDDGTYRVLTVATRRARTTGRACWARPKRGRGSAEEALLATLELKEAEAWEPVEGEAPAYFKRMRAGRSGERFAPGPPASGLQSRFSREARCHKSGLGLGRVVEGSTPASTLPRLAWKFAPSA